MDESKGDVMECFLNYSERLQSILKEAEWSNVLNLAESMRLCWQNGNRVFLCGNGGSAGNSIHLANDFLYGAAKETGIGLRAHSLASNSAILTCLANDISYEDIFSKQLEIQGSKGDILIVLSGSGSSSNVVKALETGNQMDLKTFAILGFSGGKCKELAHVPIHFPIDDMQISEDLQLVVGHMIMQWLRQHPI